MLNAAEYYVSPSGSASGDGSWNNPWDLTTALNQPAVVQPGDTLWLLGGVYRVANRPTKFVSQLAGAPGLPITLRQYPGQRATIDGNIFQSNGGWAVYWGFEIMDSQQFNNGSTPTRISPESGPFPTTWYENYDGLTNDFTVSGFDLRAPHCKLINLIIHDNIGGGIGADTNAGDAEIYGVLSYYNGWQGSDRGHGHGLYGQNALPSVKHVENSLFFDNFALGMQDYGSGPDPIADAFDLECNAFFLNGALASYHQQNLYIGPNLGIAENVVVISNYLYDTQYSLSDFVIANTDGAVLKNNYFQTSAFFGTNTGLIINGNTFLGGTAQLNPSQYPSNNYSSVTPSTNVVVVLPNKYEPGRAHILIYNWQNLDSVAVDVSGVLPANTPFQVVNAQDFYGPPVLTGVYSGGPLMLPMSGLSVAQPVATNKPAASGPAFNAFVLLPVSTGNTGSVIGAGLPGLLNGAAAWGDFDNDGKLDVLLTGQDATYSSVAQIWRNMGDGTFSNINAGLPGVVDSAVAWGDFDNDGYLDILLTGYDSNGAFISQVWRNMGDGTFTNINAGLPGVVDGAVAWGDFDNDGYLDILLTGYNYSGSIAQIWRNMGNGTFSNVNATLPGVYFSSVALGDLDHDGKLDFVLAGSTATDLICQVWRNLGNCTFSNIDAGLPGVVSGSVALGDFDNDRNLDILLTGLSSDGVTPITQVWRNLGGCNFSNINAGLPGVYYSSVAWGDYDNDGRSDILLTGYDGTNAISGIWRNLGNGTFTYANAIMPGLEDSSAAWGDYNNDGRLDALLIGYSSNAPSAAVWQNNFAPANSPPNPPTDLSAVVTGSGVTLKWHAAADRQTPTTGLNYNLRVGTYSGGSDIVAPQANTTNGWRYVPQLGNAQGCLHATLTNLPTGNYYWSVQTIDTAFAGSAFAQESTFNIGLPTILKGSFQTNGIFQLQINSGTAPVMTLQTSTNLLQWVTLVNIITGSNNNQLWFYNDYFASNFSTRFYRVGQPAGY